MTQAKRYTGKAMVVTINAIAIEADYKSVSVKEDIEDAGATAGADAHEFSLPTYRTSEIEVEMFGVKSTDTSYANIMGETDPGSTGDLVWYPEGDDPTLPVFTAGGYVKSRSIETPFEDAVALSFTYKTTEAIDEDVVPTPP